MSTVNTSDQYFVNFRRENRKMAVYDNSLQRICALPGFNLNLRSPVVFNTFLFGYDQSCYPPGALLSQSEANPEDGQIRFVAPAVRKDKPSNMQALWAAYYACKNGELGVQESALIYGVHKEELWKILGDSETVDEEFKIFVLTLVPDSAEMEIAQCVQDLLDSHVSMSSVDVRRLGYDLIREKYGLFSMPKNKNCILGRRWFQSLMEKYPELDRADQEDRNSTQKPANFFNTLEDFVVSFQIDPTTIFYMDGIDLKMEACAVKETPLGLQKKVLYIDCKALVCTNPAGMFIPPIFIKKPTSLLTTKCDVYDIDLDENDNEEEVKIEVKKEVKKEKEEEQVDEVKIKVEVKEEKDVNVDMDTDSEDTESFDWDDTAMKDTKSDDPNGGFSQNAVGRKSTKRHTRGGKENAYSEFSTSKILVKTEVQDSETESEPSAKRSRQKSKTDSKTHAKRARSNSEGTSESSAKKVREDSERRCRICGEKINQTSNTGSKTDAKRSQQENKTSSETSSKREKQSFKTGSKTDAKKAKKDSKVDSETCTKKNKQECKINGRETKKDSETGSKKCTKRTIQGSETGFEICAKRAKKDSEMGSTSCAKKVKKESQTDSKTRGTKPKKDSKDRDCVKTIKKKGSGTHGKRAQKDSKSSSEKCAKKGKKDSKTGPETGAVKVKQEPETNLDTSNNPETGESSCCGSPKPERNFKEPGFQKPSVDLGERLGEDWDGEDDLVSSDLFYSWFEKFLTHVRDSVDKKILLVLKEPDYIKDFRTVELAREYGVAFIIAPPPSHHKIHPLDGFSKSLVRNMAIRAKRWMTDNFDFKKEEFPLVEVFKKAYNVTVNLSLAVTGFFYSGFWPVNRYILFKMLSTNPMCEMVPQPRAPVAVVRDAVPKIEVKMINIKSPEDIQKLCRVCMKEGSFMKPIFSQQNSSLRFMPRQAIEELLGAPISPDDGLPTRVCNCCEIKLNDGLSTRRHAVSSHEKQLKLLKAYNRVQNGFDEKEDVELAKMVQEARDYTGVHSAQFRKLMDKVLSKTFDIMSLCRICLMEEPFKKNIFYLKTQGVNVDKEEFCHKIMVLSRSKPKEDDDLSPYICVTCLSRVNYTYKLVHQLVTSNRKYHDIVVKMRVTPRPKETTKTTNAK